MKTLELAFLATTVLAAASAIPATADEHEDTTIRPFRVSMSDADLADLKRRLAATRWPT